MILCGGRGTRSANAALPKSLQIVGGVTLLERQLKCLPQEEEVNVVLLGGWLFDQIVKHLAGIKQNFPNMKFILHKERNPSGTLNALKEALPMVTTENFMVILGDLFVSTNFANYYDYYSRTRSEILLVTHPNHHPQDSDLVLYSTETLRVQQLLPKNRCASPSDGNMAIAGIAIMTRKSIEKLSGGNDWVSSLFTTEGFPKFKIEILPVIDPIYDSGTPERLDFLSNAFQSLTSQKKIICLDLDDTLVADVQKKSAFSDFYLADDVSEQIRTANGAGIGIFVVTNQPGIAKGYFSFDDFDSFRQNIESRLAVVGAKIDRWLVCPHHPTKGFDGERPMYKIKCICRKPSPGLAWQIYSEYSIEPKNCVMVGDSDADMGFAQNANMRFIRASFEFFEKAESLESSTARAIREAVKILC